MTIATEVRENMKQAMRDKNQVALDTYRGALSAFTAELVNAGKTPQDEVSDDIALKVILKLIKQRKDAITQFEAGGRADLADEEKSQLALLEKFQPAQMSEADIRTIAEKKKIELNVTDPAKAGILTGAVMKEIAAQSAQADGGVVKTVVESLF
ncbi:MAG: GatB/YqeY domain-containing protein [Candidatus Paceibacterota bacterium]